MKNVRYESVHFAGQTRTRSLVQWLSESDSESDSESLIFQATRAVTAHCSCAAAAPAALTGRLADGLGPCQWPWPGSRGRRLGGPGTMSYHERWLTNP